MMRHFPFKEYIQYRFEKFVVKGLGHQLVLLVVVFLVVYLLSFLFRITIAFISGIERNILHEGWIVLLQLTDQGNLTEETSPTFWLKITGVITIILGIAVFSTLTGFITTQLQKQVYAYRKGTVKVSETDHTLILGWNPQGISLANELIAARKAERKASMVILADMEKDTLDEIVETRIRRPSNISIITRSGDPTNINDLNRVNVQAARSIILLATCSDEATIEEQDDSDAFVIKAVLALVGCLGEQTTIPIIVEIFSERISHLLESFEFTSLYPLEKFKVLSQLLVQSAPEGELESIYTAMFSFVHDSICFHQFPIRKMPFYDLQFYIENAIPIGIQRTDGQFVLKPARHTVINSDDQVLLFKTAGTRIRYKKSRIYDAADSHDFQATPRQSKTFSSMLLVGWNDVGRFIVEKSVRRYLKAHSRIDIFLESPSAEIEALIQQLNHHYDSVEITLLPVDPLSLLTEDDKKFLSYDHILFLATPAQGASSEKIDSETLLALLFLENRVRKYEKTKIVPPQIIAQILHPENSDLLAANSAIQGVVISNEICSIIAARISEDPRSAELLSILFDEQSSEIYLKPATLYFTTLGTARPFIEIMQAANHRNEICVGIRQHTEEERTTNSTTFLNPRKNEIFTVSERDLFIVLAENET